MVKIITKVVIVGINCDKFLALLIASNNITVEKTVPALIKNSNE